MNIKKYKILPLLCLLALSCKKEQSVVVTMFNEGSLSVRLMDGAGQGLPNVDVELFEMDAYGNYYGTTPIAIKQTDGSGAIDFGLLRPAAYRVVADEVFIGKLPYAPQYNFQVLANRENSQEVDVTTFSGAYSVGVYDSWTGQGATGYRVMIVPYELPLDFAGSITPELISKAAYDEPVSESGNLVFRIPSDRSFTLYVYSPETGKIIVYNYIYLYKDEEGGVQYYTYP